MEMCPCCGDWASFGVSEVYPELRKLVLHACCHENLCGWIAEIASWSRRRRVQWMLYETGLLVREIVLTEDVLSWTFDYGLRLEPVDFATARDFIRDHHRHCVPPVGWKYGAAVFNGSERIGVVTAGRPISAELARQGCIEVNRVCVRDYPATRAGRERLPYALRVRLSRGVPQGILSRRNVHVDQRKRRLSSSGWLRSGCAK